MKTRMLVTFILLLSLVPSFKSQEPVKQDDVVRVTTNLVQVDVVVTDKTGQHVKDLRPEDFELLEDRKRKDIIHFSYIVTDGRSTKQESAETAATPTPTSSQKTMARVIAIVVDDLGLSAESMISVKEALAKFINEQMQANDQVAIIRTSRGVGALQQFSSDKRRLMAAVENLRWFSAGRGGLSTFSPVDTQQGDDSTQAAQVISEMEEQRAAKYAVGTLGTLRFVIRGLNDLPGRKAVVLVAESFKLFTTQGRNVQLIDSLNHVTDEANLASTVIYTIDASGLNPLTLNAEDRVSGPSYTFDPNAFQGPGGVASLPIRNRGTPRRNDVAPTSASIAQEEGGSSAAFKRLDALMAQRDNQNFQTQSVLSYLAQRTGGLFTANTNNLSLGTRNMLEDQQGYYLLGYRPDESIIDPATGRRRYHDLTVKVKRPGLRVRSRAGYYGVPSEIAAQRRNNAQQLTAALISPFGAGGVGLRVTPLFFNDQKAGSYVRALLHINATDLTFKEHPDGSRRSLLDFAAVNFDEAGQVVDHFTDTQDLTVASDAYPEMLQNGLSFILNVPVKQAGAYQLRVAVRDVASERTGSAGQFIEIPDLKKNTLALSGLVISGLNPNTTGSASISPPVQQDGANRKPAEDRGSQTGPAVRRLRRGMILSYGYTIYNAEVKGSNPPQLQTQMVLFREGKQVFAGKVSPYDASKQVDLNRLKVNGGLRIGPELTPGEYVLQVLVKDNLRDKQNEVTQSLDFEIVE